MKPNAIVEYEHSGSTLLGIIVEERKNRWVLKNEVGKEVILSSDRLYLLPGNLPEEAKSKEQQAAFLHRLNQEALDLQKSISLEELWETVLGELTETSAQELTELAFPEDSLANRLATRRALLSDKVFFKRKKTSFEPRSAEAVDELKIQVAAEARKEAERSELVAALLDRISGEQSQLPVKVKCLEQLAAVGTSSPTAKEAIALCSRVIEEGKLKIDGKPEQKAFKILVAATHFSPDENLGFHRFRRAVGFKEAVSAEAAALAQAFTQTPDPNRQDLTSAYTITIDGHSTRDIDDALSLEKTASGFQLGIHISDVAAAISQGSELEIEAQKRATSVYCPDSQVPMFPPAVSENTLSLVEGQNRYAVSSLIDLDESFNLQNRRICRSLIRVDKRISYEASDEALFSEGSETSRLDSQAVKLINMLWEVSAKLEIGRIEKGAVYFSRREMTPVIAADGTISLEEVTDDTPSRKLVGEMMILANETAALFAKEKNLPLIFRGQEAPDTPLSEAGLNMPEGPAREYAQRALLKRSAIATTPMPHSSLGVDAYVHATSPIRRVADLVNQRQLCSCLESGEGIYSQQEVVELMGSVESSLSEAVAIQRESQRYWLLKYLKQQKIKEIGGVVVRVEGKKPLAEIDILFSLRPFHPISSKSEQNSSHKKKPGETVLLKIQSIDPRTDTLVLREVEN